MAVRLCARQNPLPQPSCRVAGNASSPWQKLVSDDTQPIAAAVASASTHVEDHHMSEGQRPAATARVDEPVKRAAVRSSPGLRPENRLRTPLSAWATKPAGAASARARAGAT